MSFFIVLLSRVNNTWNNAKFYMWSPIAFKMVSKRSPFSFQKWSPFGLQYGVQSSLKDSEGFRGSRNIESEGFGRIPTLLKKKVFPIIVGHDLYLTLFVSQYGLQHQRRRRRRRPSQNFQWMVSGRPPAVSEKLRKRSLYVSVARCKNWDTWPSWSSLYLY